MAQSEIKELTSKLEENEKLNKKYEEKIEILNIAIEEKNVQMIKNYAIHIEEMKETSESYEGKIQMIHEE